MAELAVGSRIGEYVVERDLGPRGAGDVYLARHAVLRRLATVTVLPARPGSVPAGLVREVYTTDTLDHPAIPRVYECGILPDRRPWMATERIEGRTVTAQLERSSVSALDAAIVVRDVAEILEHAHARAVVHGNVSADAIVLAEGRPRFPICLTDWTLADTLDPRGLGGAGDVYGLGVVARQLLQRACPGSAPPVFAALVHRMLADGPAQRPTASEVRDHAAWLAGEIEPEHAIPHLVEDDLAIETPPPFRRPITSEIAPNVSGEFRQRRR